MRRAKVGDVYAFKTERGYRILQWAYKIEKWGRYVRVFPNFYDKIPDNIEDIVRGECSYIISFHIPKLYQKGLLEFLCTVPIESIPPFPKYDIDYVSYGNNRGEYEICEFACHNNSEYFEGLADGTGLPKKYKDLKLINGSVDPVWFIYLLTSDFDMKHWDLFYPGKATHSEYLKKYEKQLF